MAKGKSKWKYSKCTINVHAVIYKYDSLSARGPKGSSPHVRKRDEEKGKKKGKSYE